MIDKFMLTHENSALLIIDIQERLATAMSRKDQVTANCLHLIELARLKNMPIVVTEQYPKGLGPTVPELREALKEITPLEKITFSCCGGEGFNEQVASTGRKKIIVTGMETHVCVLTTVLDLLRGGYDVHVVGDAICSRSDDNWRTALEMMRDAGAVITCTESVLFQCLERAGSEEFKIISKRIR